MNSKHEETYRRVIKKLISDTYKLKFDYIGNPSLDEYGELIPIPQEKFRSHVTQARMLTRNYGFIEAQDDRSIFLKLANLRDSDINIDTQAKLVTELIQLLDAIASQIESGVLCFRVGMIAVSTQGSLDQISSIPLNYMDKELRSSISHDISELSIAVQCKMYKTVALLAGSITESVLLGVANLNRPVSENIMQSYKPKRDFPDRCGIEELAHICRSEGIISDSSLSPDIIRDYRDHIHPNKHTKSKTELDEHSVNIILGTLGKILKNIFESAQKGLLQHYKEKELGR